MTFHSLVELAGSQTTKMGSQLQAATEDKLVMAGREAIKARKVHRHRTTRNQLQAGSAV
jgi:hypothetical protein